MGVDDILISLIFFTILLIYFICRVLQHDMADKKLMFVSIFTFLTGISISSLVSNGDDNFSFFVKCIAVIFMIYGFISGVQLLSRKN